MDDPESDDELNRDLMVIEYDDKIDNDKEEHIPRAKVRPIKKTKNKKSSSLTVDKEY